MSHFKPPCINPTAPSIFFFKLTPPTPPTPLSMCLSFSLFTCMYSMLVLLLWFSHVSLLNLDLYLDGKNLMDLIPRSCKFPLAVVHYTQVLSMESLQKEGVISEPFRPDSGRQPITGVWQEKKLLEVLRNISLAGIWSCCAESLMMLSVKWCFQGLYFSVSLLKLSKNITCCYSNLHMNNLYAANSKIQSWV